MHNVVQHAVDSEANSEIFFVWLDVNVDAPRRSESTINTLTSRTTGASSLAVREAQDRSLRCPRELKSSPS
jgi:hypothetical protein